MSHKIVLLAHFQKEQDRAKGLVLFALRYVDAIYWRVAQKTMLTTITVVVPSLEQVKMVFADMLDVEAILDTYCTAYEVKVTIRQDRSLDVVAPGEDECLYRKEGLS